MTNLTNVAIPVEGGRLRVATHQGRSGGPVVILVHGITANHLAWAMVVDQLGDDVTIFAPDLRGRAGSASLPGPFGMVAHARDLVAILDHVGVDTATVVGHSMGAFVACAFAAHHADRLAGLVLVDGGVSLGGVPEGHDIDATLRAILGPTMERLSMTFASQAAWLDFWKAHPALQDWNDEIEAYVLADMVDRAPNLRSSCNIDAIRVDGAEILGEGGQWFRRLTHPTPWLRAPRGLLNGPPLYPDDEAAQICTEVAALQDQLVDNVNHFTITLSERGARVVAKSIRSQLPA